MLPERSRWSKDRDREQKVRKRGLKDGYIIRNRSVSNATSWPSGSAERMIVPSLGQSWG